MLRPATIRARLREERGFTLIEALVAMVSGMIVIGATFAILEVSLHESTRQADYTQASQLGRTAMTKVVDVLHSTCLTTGFAPVQAKSGPNRLIVQDGFSEEAEVKGTATVTNGARQDEFWWKEVAGKRGNLMQTTWLSTSGSAPSYVIPTTGAPASEVRVAENVKREVKGKEEQPFFKYFKYATKSTTGTSEQSATLTEVTPKESTFTEPEAREIAAVQVSFTQLPTDGNEALGRVATFSNQVTFAFTAPSTEATIEAHPCE